MKLVKEDKLKKHLRDEIKPTTAGMVDRRLFANLKELRLAIANERNVPAFTIFHDSSLTDMCIKMPTTMEEFLDVSGVGKVKMEQYGKRFVSVISEFLRDNDTETNGF